MTASRVAAPMSAPPLRLIIGLGGLYVGQSVIGGVIFTGLPAVMRQNGASLNDIALILLTVLPWSFKFLWAPALERFRSPHGARRRSRLTIGLVGPFAVGAVVACALIGPTALGPLTIAMMVASFSSATIDIACDGHAVESLAEQNRGWGNAAQVGGAYLGSAIGGGLFLVMIDHWGWRPSALIMAGVLVALAAPFLLMPDDAPAAAADRPRQSLMRAFRRPQVQAGLLLVAVYVLGQKWAMVLIGPYLVDAGLSLTTIGSVNGIGVTALGLAGALGGGWVLKRISAFRVMAWALAAQLAVMFAFALTASLGGTSATVLIGLSLTSSGALALGFTALYAELMGSSSLDQAGVDFTLFQSADAIVSLIGWRLAGSFGDVLGYGFCFGAAGLFGLLALSLMPWLRRRNDRATLA